jgi:thiopurine S-methyltransferase
MIWLAKQGHSVTGLEMVEQAVKTFFSENELEYNTIENSNQKIHTSEPYTIIQGNIFDIESGLLKADAWYDRAAMIAIEPSDRKPYVEQIRNQTNAGAAGLLITFAYPQEQMEGPPFALHDTHVYDLFSEGFMVECLEKIQLEDDKDRGLSNVTSTVFKIIRI